MKLVKDKISKKSILIMPTLLLALLAACGGQSSSTANDDSKENYESKETFTLRYNTMYPPSVWEWAPKYKATEEFAKLLEERTDGRVKVEIYYSNQLAGQAESLDALSSGTIDIQNVTPSAWADRVPEGSFSSLPFGWMGEEHLMHLLRETEVGKLYEEALDDYGVKLLFYSLMSTAGYMSDSPIVKPDDFKGLIMNTTSNMQIDWYESMGAGIANIPLADQYEALMRGTLDAIQFPYYSLETYKLDEVVDTITVPGTVAPSFNTVTMSNATWEKLPADIQETVMEVASEMEEASIEGSKKLTKQGLEYAEENGIEIVKMTEENYNQFSKMGQEKVWKKLSEVNERAKKITETIIAEREKWIKEKPEANEYLEEYLAE